jgi:hypothetical protein
MSLPLQQFSTEPQAVPDRLNLAIARDCFVSCRGCYSYFGRVEPDLPRLLSSVSRFVKLGVHSVTIAGGDPLTIKGILAFLIELRRIGIRSIKLDTVGTGLAGSTTLDRIPRESSDRSTLPALIERVDWLGIPLDGWSEKTVSLFRAGRAQLYRETRELLDAADLCAGHSMIIINTVAHAVNLHGVHLIAKEVLKHRAICHWNVFQFSPTDGVPKAVNEAYCISDEMFDAARKAWQETPASRVAAAHGIDVEFKSTRSRLGQYLLVNSDGAAWMPDQHGRTISLGPVFDRERQVLQDWRVASLQLRALRSRSGAEGPTSACVRIARDDDAVPKL